MKSKKKCSWNQYSIKLDTFFKCIYPCTYVVDSFFLYVIYGKKIVYFHVEMADDFQRIQKETDKLKALVLNKMKTA